MIRLLPTALALLALGAALWWLLAVVQERAALRLELREARLEVLSARAALEQAEEAARVHRAYLSRLEAERLRWTEIERELQSMEGRDAPLSPLLQSAADRLFAR